MRPASIVRDYGTHPRVDTVHCNSADPKNFDSEFQSLEHAGFQPRGAKANTTAIRD